MTNCERPVSSSSSHVPEKMFYHPEEGKITKVVFGARYAAIENVLSVTDSEAVGKSTNQALMVDRHIAESASGYRMHIPKRYIVTFLAAVGYFAKFMIELNWNLVIVEITSNKTVNNGNETKPVPAEFQWTSMEKGLLLGAFSLGTIFSFMGGPLIHKLGGSKTVSAMSLISAIIELASPLLFHVHIYACTIGRVFVGLTEGFSTAAFASTFAEWSPPKERCRLISLAFTGHIVSGAVNYPISGYIVHTSGWRAVFYVSGSFLLVWSIVWSVLVSNSPADDRFISETERNYLKDNCMANEETAVPWKEILTSKPMYALANELFCAGWCSSFTAVCLPLYIKDMYNVNTREVGLLTGLPMLCNMVALPIAAFIADYLRSHFSGPAQIHRIFITGGQLLIFVFLLMATIRGDFVVCMICFCLMRIAYGFVSASYQVIYIDMGGQYAGVLKSLAHTGFSIGHLLNPLVLGFMVRNHSAIEWNWYFVVLCCISLFGIAMFLKFGDAGLQPWAVTSEKNVTENQPAELMSSSQIAGMMMESKG